MGLWYPQPSTRISPSPKPCTDSWVAPADYFRGDNPDMAPVMKGDFTAFMAWRDRHGANAVLPESEKVDPDLDPQHPDPMPSARPRPAMCSNGCAGGLCHIRRARLTSTSMLLGSKIPSALYTLPPHLIRWHAAGNCVASIRLRCSFSRPAALPRFCYTQLAEALPLSTTL